LITQPATYTRTAISLHWVIALLIFAAFPLGLYMSDLPVSPNSLRLYSYHKWMGITVLVLAVLRLVWRITHRPPELPITMPRWERVAAASMHHLLYILIFIVPLTGWLMSSAKGFQTVWFGVIPLPDLVGKDKALGHLLKEWHEYLNYLMLVLVIGHIATALRHHFIVRDNILTQMLPCLSKSK